VRWPWQRAPAVAPVVVRRPQHESYFEWRLREVAREPLLPDVRPVVQDTDGWWGEVLSVEGPDGLVLVRMTSAGTDPYSLDRPGEVFDCHVSHLRIRGYQ